ncbi:MAG: IS1634 family transposase [Chlorobi bacterium]|nr:IS1634 family transposase [Chlorobiota bacterium]
MFVRRKTSKNSPKIAIQLVENVRTGKKVKQKIIRHFGTALDENEAKVLTQLALIYQARLQEQSKQLALFDKDTFDTIEKLVESSQAKQPERLDVNLKNIVEEKRIVTGIHQVFGKIFDAVGFQDVLKNPSNKKASVKLLKNVVIGRIAEPASKRQTARMLSEEYGINTQLTSIYRMMDFIDNQTIEKIQEKAFLYTKQLRGENLDVVFYDCTSLYFESFQQEGLMQNGFSKDGKFNQAQIILSILVTKQGLPVGYQVYSGNTFEGNTLEDAIKLIKEKYTIDEVIFVADSGLISHKNIENLHDNNVSFIMGARIKNQNKKITEQILEKSDRQLISDKQSEKGLKYKQISISEHFTMTVTYSPKRAEKDKYEREKAIEKLKQKLKKSKNPKGLLSNFGYKKFIKIEGEAQIEIDETKLKEAQKWDGLKGIVSNTKNLSPLQQITHYAGLWQVEETFRISKHDVKMRPIYHWTDKRIQAHIAICFMALSCMRFAEYEVAARYKKISPLEIRRQLKQVQTSILKDKSTGKLYALPSKIQEDAYKITKYSNSTI